jgi:hypothetical protein
MIYNLPNLSALLFSIRKIKVFNIIIFINYFFIIKTYILRIEKSRADKLGKLYII